ncbi:MAG: hypothetical protein QOH41_525 [Blastocatellia bacterium]|jgi:glycosyltransferase involved in cell wall biosynthesis|nr:hypothetical protein [Blastocatellia bacterium]
MSLPRVSVTIPSYNHARYLPETIDSILSQSFQDFELIIVDDGSTDDSLEIAYGYAAKYPEKIRVLTHPERANKGISATVNLGLENVRGEFWTPFPSDDVLYPWGFETQVNFLDTHRDLAWCYGYADVIDSEGKPFPEWGKCLEIDISQDDDPLERLLCANRIPAMTVLIRRETLERMKLRLQEDLLYSDWEFWLRLTAHFRPGYIAERPLVKFRVHSYNTSVGVDPTENVLRGLPVLESIDAHRKEIGGGFNKARVRVLLQLQIAEHNYRAKREKAALIALKKAFRENPKVEPDFVLDWLTAMANSGFDEWFVSHLPEVGRRARAILRRKIERARRKIERDCWNEIYALHHCTPGWHPSRILAAINYRLRNHIHDRQ